MANQQPRNPVSTPASLEVDEDGALAAQLSSSDPDNDPLTFATTGAPSHGTLTLTAAGAATYLPATNYNGPDAFTVTVSDGRGGSAVATFNVTVRAVNDAPSFTSTTATFAEDSAGSAQVGVVDVENDPIELIAVTNPMSGVLLGTGSMGQITYTPNPNFAGQDSFVGRLRDSQGALSADATLTLTVTNINDGPVATDDAGSVTSGAADFDVIANDSDADGDALTVTLVTAPQIGTATVQNNRIRYTPPSGYSGPAVVRYRVADPSGLTAEATLHISAGAFEGVLLLNEEASGRTHLYLFDGVSTVQIADTYGADNFAQSSDGRHIFYGGRYTQSDQGSLFWFDADLPRAIPTNPQRIYTRQGPASGTGPMRYVVNADGTYLLLIAPFDISPYRHEVLYVPTRRFYTLTFPAGVYPISPGSFNPVSSEFYVPARVSTAIPPSPNNSIFTSLYAGQLTNPQMQRIGGLYDAGVGEGSGLNVTVTADGTRIVHGAAQFTPDVNSLLVNDRASDTETDLFRAFAPGEFPVAAEFDANRSGTRTCFRLNAPGSAAAGPGRFWVADASAPGAATAITPVADSNSNCQFTSDGHTFTYLSANGASPTEMWVADAQIPNAVQRAREPLTAGQSLVFHAVASHAMVAIVGIAPTPGANPVFHRVDLTAPGSSTLIAAPDVSLVSGQFALSPRGDWLGYVRADTVGGVPVKRLHIINTRLPATELVVDLPPPVSGQVGVERYEFRPPRM